jgi:hypothetical protein
MEARLTVPSTVRCSIVQDCLFSGLTHTENGAAAWLGGSGPVFVTGTTLVNCHTTRRGGGLYFETGSVQIESCCFRDLTVDDLGTAIAINYEHANLNLSVSSLVKCGKPTSRGRATIFVDTDQWFAFSALNFSSCNLPGSTNEDGLGFVLWCYISKGDPWSFRYCSVYKCSGATGFHHNYDAIATVEYCNFYENVAHPSRALFSCYQTGMIVRFCIFRDNTRDLMLHEDRRHPFVIQDCVFSSPDSVIANDWWTDADSTRNLFGSYTASIAITHLANAYCEIHIPDATPIASPSFYFTMPAYPLRTHRSMLISTACFLWLRS